LPEEIGVAPDGYAKAKKAISYIGGILAILGVDYKA